MAKKQVYVMWHGGPSYGGPWQWEDLEVFESLSAAKTEHWRREHDGYGTDRRVGNEPRTLGYPAVSNSRSDVYLADPREAHDVGPDRVIMIGPRGGVRVMLPSAAIDYEGFDD